MNSQSERVNSVAAACHCSSGFSKHLTAGLAASLAGGLVFGMMMQMMGMIPMVAGLVGSQSAVIGWAVHLIISAVLGATFAGLHVGAGILRGQPIAAGAVYGLVLWALFPVTFMPLMMGMPVMWSLPGLISTAPSLMGHLIYGTVMGLVYRSLAR